MNDIKPGDRVTPHTGEIGIGTVFGLNSDGTYLVRLDSGTVRAYTSEQLAIPAPWSETEGGLRETILSLNHELSTANGANAALRADRDSLCGALSRAHALLRRSERQVAVMSGGPGVDSLAELLRQAIADHLDPRIDA